MHAGANEGFCKEDRSGIKDGSRFSWQWYGADNEVSRVIRGESGHILVSNACFLCLSPGKDRKSIRAILTSKVRRRYLPQPVYLWCVRMQVKIKPMIRGLTIPKKSNWTARTTTTFPGFFKVHRMRQDVMIALVSMVILVSLCLRGQFSLSFLTWRDLNVLVHQGIVDVTVLPNPFMLKSRIFNLLNLLDMAKDEGVAFRSRYVQGPEK